MSSWGMRLSKNVNMRHWEFDLRRHEYCTAQPLEMELQQKYSKMPGKIPFLNGSSGNFSSTEYSS